MCCRRHCGLRPSPMMEGREGKRSLARYLCGSVQHTPLLLAVMVFLCWWLWTHCPTVVYYSTSDSKENASDDRFSHSFFLLHKYSQEDPLVHLLGNLTFRNYGIVKRSDRFTWRANTCQYLEAENVRGPYQSWAMGGHCDYLFHDVSGDLIPPPTGMRSSVPLGGISTGSFELRADGTFHEWTIFNQHPAGAAKIQLINDVFMGVRAAVSGRQPVSVVLQTHPSDPRLPAVKALKYHGAHPVSKLDVLDSRLPMDVSVYAYPWYRHNDMNRSATPAVAFTAVMKNLLMESVTASFMFNLPLGIEALTQRWTQQMPTNVSTSYTHTYQSKRSTSAHPSSTPLECFMTCNLETSCMSWSYDIKTEMCYMFTDVRLNGYDEGSFAGVKGSWSVSGNCITLNRAAEGSSANGNVSLCPFSTDEKVSFSFGAGVDVPTLWKEYHEKGQFTSPEGEYYVTGATAASVTLAPGETKEVTIVLGWFFPDRDFLGLPVGNLYSHLFEDSMDAARQLGQNLTGAVADIANLHTTFFHSSLPHSLQDMLINSLSHIRSALWLRDGRWRQWEAYDCVNLESVHNDGERHIPYIAIFPHTVVSKMYGWAKYQLPNGMIQEQLRCGCTSLPLEPQAVEFGCGRIMSDVSSMFIVYLLELLTWQKQDDTVQQLMVDLWPHAKRAAQWQLNVSAADGIPSGLCDTYDHLGLSGYPHDTYGGAFHLLAMRAAEILAHWMHDADFAVECRDAYLRGQQALDHLLWNESTKYYNAYIPCPSSYPCTPHPVGGSHPNVPGAIMTDTFYAQVLAYTLGLGTLVQNETRLRLHMKAELHHSDTPYGMLVMTGRYPYPGPSVDNAVWMMGNPNWATINIHLNEDVDQALEVGLKVFEHWRSVSHDQWNVVGIMGGLGYGADGLPYITSHYGFYMSSWHIIMALSGQQANMTTGSLTFAPKISPPFTLPVLMPGAWGYLRAISTPHNLGRKRAFYLDFHFGFPDLQYLAVDGCECQSKRFVFNDHVLWSWGCMD